MSRGSKELIHVRLSSSSKSSMASAEAPYSTGPSFNPVIVKAMANVVVVSMESSDQVLCAA